MATFPEENEDDLQPEYNFRAMHGVVRGKYAKRYQERLRVVRLAEDVAGAFVNEAEVNEALREFLRSRHSQGSTAEQAAITDRRP
jgi:aromatic ring hydroxylase